MEEAKVKANQNKFVQGYICAVSHLIRERDQPGMAAGLLQSLGDISVKKLKEYGVDAFDLAPLIKHKLIK